MKKGLKRGIAALIALFMLGCDILPSIGTIAANSNSQTNSSETPKKAYVKYDFEGVDLSEMELTSTRFAKSSPHAMVDGTLDQPISSHWTTTALSTDNGKPNTGLKVTTKNTASQYSVIPLISGCEDFQMNVDLYASTGFGITLGNKNAFPTAGGNNGVSIRFEGGYMRLVGTFDSSTLQVTGTAKAYSWVTEGRDLWFHPSSNTFTNMYTNRQSETVNIKVEDNVLTLWLNSSDTVLSITMQDSNIDGTVSLFGEYYNLGGGFKSVRVRQYDAKYDFEGADLSQSTLTSTQYAKSSPHTVIVGTENNAIAEQWFTGQSGYTTYTEKKNNGLKPANNNSISPSRYSVIPLVDRYQDFEMSVDLYASTGFGVAIGNQNVFPSSGGNNGARIRFESGYMRINGSFDASTLSVSGTAKAYNWVTSGQDLSFHPSSNTFTNMYTNRQLETLHIKVIDKVLTVWLDSSDTRLSIEMTESNLDGTISLFGEFYNGGGGFKNAYIRKFTITPAPQPEVPATPAVVGDSFSEDFENLSALTDLDADFDSYYFENTSASTVKGKPSQQWAIGKDIYTNTASVLRNDWLKPVHAKGGNKHTLLTYKSKIFTNVEVEAEYVTNHVDYGVMIAPKAELATAQNGIKVYVNGSGTIKIGGAIDAGSATATGGYVYIGGQNSLSGYAVPNYVKASGSASNESNCTSYTLHIRISGDVMQVWLNEYPEYVISVELTEAYEGGLVSLYALGLDHGAFKSFSARENEGSNTAADSSVYTQSFNTISSLDELKDDFSAYTLGSAKAEVPVAANIEDIYQLSNGKLKSNLDSAGTDYSGFGILTLKNKRYENFELTLKYIQDPDRYAVMIGTELGEFAYTGDSALATGNGGVLVYTEMQGYRNIRGSLYASSYTDAKIALSRKTEEPKLESFVAFKSTTDGVSDVLNTLNQTSLHTMTIRVVDGYLTMIVDNNEASRVTVRLADYDGGYISLVTTARKNSTYGSFASLAIRELDENAELNTTLPETTDGFETMKQVEKLFDAYYLDNVKESSKLEKVKLKEKWWLNKGGSLTRVKGGTAIDVNGNMDILTYKKQKFTDFELTYTYQQTYQRTGILIGGDLGEYTLSCDENGKLQADKGAVIYIEAQGYPNVKGHLHNYTNKSDLLYRVTTLAPDGFVNGAGSAMDNVSAKKEHMVKIVVKDQKLYVFLDGSEEASLYVKLGDDYKGGYVSLFSAASNEYGIGNFTITDKVTTKLPKAGGVEVTGDTLTAKFDTAEFDDSLFTTYYLAAVKNNENGTMKQTDFDDQWTVANGTIKRTSAISNGADDTKVSALTYNRSLTDFVATYEYQQDSNRLMFMLGAEKGKYALSHNGKGTQMINGGVVLYPEFDLGSGGGIVALGDIYPLSASWRPIVREQVYGLDYYVKANGGAEAHLGNWHTMTIAVINQHCYIYIDDYGLVQDFSLGENYKGGYVSIAASGNTYGFRNLQIKDLSALTEQTVVSAENPRDITVTARTEANTLKLPSTVKVTLKNGKTVDASVDWIDFNYDAAKVGTYKFTGVVKEAAGIDNPALVGVQVNIRVVDQLPTVNSNVKEWTFDTNDDLKDFQTSYLKDAATGYVTNGAPLWFVNENTGVLHRDNFRTVTGNESKNVAVMTYTGEQYKNFELEVDYSWHSSRMMVMFGSEKIGEYINLNDMKSDKNPAAVFVEMEGVRNVIGNVRNTNYYTRTEKFISTARDNGDRIPNYYNKENLEGNIGTMHHMKIRVVGQQVSIWVDDYKEPFVTTLINYDGGYISLVSVTKGGVFDNLKITRLSDNLTSEVEDTEAVANGFMDLKLDANAATDLVIPERDMPEVFDDKATDKSQHAAKAVPFLVVGGGVILISTLIGLLFILLAWKKRKKGERA